MILLHESVHYIKQYGAENNTLTTIVTEQEYKEELITEEGKRLIKYLFNQNCIEVISFEQAIQLFQEEKWNTIAQLQKIFEKILPQKTTDTISFMYNDDDNSGCLSYPKYCYSH